MKKIINSHFFIGFAPSSAILKTPAILPTQRYLQFPWKQHLKMAASLEVSQIQTLFREKDEEKRKILLGKFLKFPDFDEDDDLRSGILLDIYSQCLCFVVEQGIPWNQVAVFFELVQDLLQNITEGY